MAWLCPLRMCMAPSLLPCSRWPRRVQQARVAPVQLIEPRAQPEAVMARKRQERDRRPKVHARIACRRRELLTTAVEGPIGYLEGYASAAIAVPQPSSGSEVCEIECPVCARTVKIRVASPT